MARALVGRRNEAADAIPLNVHIVSYCPLNCASMSTVSCSSQKSSEKLINMETHNEWKYKEQVSGRFSPQMGHLYHNLLSSKLGEHYRRKGRKIGRARGPGGPGCNSIFWTLRDHHCPHKVYAGSSQSTFQHRWERNTQAPIPDSGAIDSW